MRISGTESSPVILNQTLWYTNFKSDAGFGNRTLIHAS